MAKKIIKNPKNLAEALQREFGQSGQKMPDYLRYLVEEIEEIKKATKPSKSEPKKTK